MELPIGKRVGEQLVKTRRVRIGFIALGAAMLAFACLAEDSRTTPSAAPVVVKTQGYLPFADAPIHYRSQALNDPVANLEKRLERGEITLRHDPKYGYLPAVLAALHVPVSSQTLVFSKTSFQYPEISPAAPRALYFNDDVYVGRVQRGKFLEFVSFDPMLGAVFYVMDENESEHPRFERAEVDCVQCHVAASTHGVPGVLMRSVFTRPSGYPVAGKPAFITGQESPYSERWGGWYVTAKNGPEPHMGNMTSPDAKPPEVSNRLPATLDTTPYLARSSDIVALMVLAHQTQMHNLITQANYQTRLALYADENQGGLPAGTVSDAARKRFEKAAEQLLRYLLFTNEARLEAQRARMCAAKQPTNLALGAAHLAPRPFCASSSIAPVAGTSNFAEEFAERGPRDAQGRSLRDFDLHTRIFKYPCSYLIYSDDFDAIPAPAKDYIYHRLFEILTGRDQSPDFASLSSEDRQNILEILVATKPGLPDEWKQVRSAGLLRGRMTAPSPARFTANANQTGRER